MLRDVSQIDMRVRLFDEWSEFPICVAPTATQRLAHPAGEVATAKGIQLYTCVYMPCVWLFMDPPECM